MLKYPQGFFEIFYVCQMLAPKGNPLEKFEEEMLNYAHNLTKAHKNKIIHQKLDEILNRN